jgi:hypothetical protein
MRDGDDLLKPQLGDDGIEVTDLIRGGIRIAGRLIRTPPPEKIKCPPPGILGRRSGVDSAARKSLGRPSCAPERKVPNMG